MTKQPVKPVKEEKVQMVAPMLSLEEVEHRETLQRRIMALESAISIMMARQDPPLFVNTLIGLKNDLMQVYNEVVQHSAPRPANTVPKEEIEPEGDGEGEGEEEGEG